MSWTETAVDFFLVTTKANGDSVTLWWYCTCQSRELFLSDVLQVCLKSQTSIVSKDSPELAYNHSADFTHVIHYVLHTCKGIFPSVPLCHQTCCCISWIWITWVFATAVLRQQHVSVSCLNRIDISHKLKEHKTKKSSLFLRLYKV